MADFFDIPDNLDWRLAVADYGIYAFRTLDGKEILAVDCKHIRLRREGHLYYMPNNTRNVVNVVERWIWVPYHAIAGIAFNEKPKTDEQKALDDLPH